MADKIDNFVLKEKYRDRDSCRWAAKGAVAGVGADVLDDFANTSGATSAIDAATGFAIMRCAGMSVKQIVLYHVVLIVLAVVLFILVQKLIPSSLFKNCTICSKNKEIVDPKTKQRKTVCEKYRPGSPKECQSAGNIVKVVLGVIGALIVVGITNGVVHFVLKSKIFTPAALIGETVARSLV